MWPFSKKQKVTDPLALSLTAVNGNPFETFPTNVVDNLRLMLTRIAHKEAIPSRLALVAALQEEGTTYISRALGTTMANDLETTICVVELNWWRPSNSNGALGKSHGLAAVLLGKAALDDVIVQTNQPNLSLIPAGQLPEAKRSTLARSSVLCETLDDLNKRFDHLILDIPAVLASTDAIPLASQGTACCLVLRQGATSIDDARSALDDLTHMPMLGVLMNRVHLSTPTTLLRYIPQR